MSKQSVLKSVLFQVSSFFLVIGCIVVFSASYFNDLFIRFESKTPTFLFHTTMGSKLFNGKRLPVKGNNFESYSPLLSLIGRTHVHSKVRDIVLNAYKMLEFSSPTTMFIYGETGWKNGGNFWPHKTHRNGLSVDFIVPVLDLATRQPRRLFLNPFNLYGYSTRFNHQGISGGVQIDFHAIVEHLYALKISCHENNMSIQRVIIDPPLLQIIQQDPDYEYIDDLPFMLQQAWFPHDSHYHIDFEL